MEKGYRRGGERHVSDIREAAGMHAGGSVDFMARCTDGTVVDLINAQTAAALVHGGVAANGGAAPAHGAISPDLAVCGIYANLGSSWFGPNITMTAENHGNYLDIVTRGIPVYGRNIEPVTLRIPRGWIVANTNTVGVKGPLNSDSVRLMLSNGKAFPHPHVWDTGIPCWSGASMTSIESLFSMHVNTLSWVNVTRDAQRYGHFTSNEIVRAFGPDPWRSINAHKERVAGCITPQNCSSSAYFSARFPNLLNIVAGGFR